MGTAYFLLSLSFLAVAWNVYRPIYRGPRAAVVSFFVGWLTGELALWHVAAQVGVTLVFAAAGAFDSAWGQTGLVVAVAAWAALAWHMAEADLAGPAADGALVETFGRDYAGTVVRPVAAASPAPSFPWRSLLLPFSFRRAGVERTRDLVFRNADGIDLRLDVYRSKTTPSDAPVLMMIHGGGWTIGSKNEQGIPLLLRMAEAGWVCFSVDYRLSPKATYPDHLVDVKAALAWIKTHAAEYGGNPEFVAVTGNSAGGHLSSLLALTPGDTSLQPDFEDADLDVAACVPFYGVYDWTDRFGYWPNRGLRDLIEAQVMKRSLADHREEYHEASPLDRIHEDAPPFFVVHGDRDTLVPVAEARAFVVALRKLSNAPTSYLEVPGAQHAFDVFHSLRTEHVNLGVERFLGIVYGQWLARRGSRASAAA